MDRLKRGQLKAWAGSKSDGTWRTNLSLPETGGGVSSVAVHPGVVQHLGLVQVDLARLHHLLHLDQLVQTAAAQGTPWKRPLDGCTRNDAQSLLSLSSPSSPWSVS